MRKKISIYVNNNPLSPSGYYRIIQYFKQSEEGVNINSLMPTSVFKNWHKTKNKYVKTILKIPLFILISSRTLYFLIRDSMRLRDGDLIISKTTCPHYLTPFHAYFLKRISKNNKIFWDFDDHILDSHSISNKEFNLLSEISNKIIVTNNYLKDTIQKQYHSKVELLSTTDGDLKIKNFEEVLSLRLNSFSTEIKLVWVATAVNLIHLKRIIPVLDQCALRLKKDHNKKLILNIVCNQMLNSKTQHLYINNIIWTRDVARKTMMEAHIGIMPLIDNDFTRGKGGFKLVQYMGMCLPIIGSSVGYNKEVINPEIGFCVEDKNKTDGWIEPILMLSTNQDLLLKMTYKSRQNFQERFSFEEHKNKWENWLKEV